MKIKFSKKKILISSIISIVVIFIILVVVMLSIKFNKNVYNNIYLNGHDVSKYSPEELVMYVNQLSNDLNKISIEIIQDENKIYTVTPEMIDASIDINATVKQVISIGRNEGIFSNTKKFFDLLFNKEDLKCILEFNEEKVETLVKNIELTLNNRVVYDTYLVDKENNKLILNKGKDGYTIDCESLKKELVDCMSKMSSDKLNIELKEQKSFNLDKEKIISEVKREAKDAYIDDSTNPATFIEEVIGIELNENELSENLENLKLLSDYEKIEMDLVITMPKVLLKDIRYDTYDSKLASYTTYFAGNQKNRANNIKVASEYLNDVIIMPGEIFSFNDTVGQITEEKGYLNAATFQGGKVVDGIGGGICQVSSTLYNTALLANLEIVERYAHSMPVSYVLPSRDATIYVGALDFKFKNTRKYPIKIVASYSPTGSINISMYGTKEEKEYTIEIESKTLEEIDFITEYIKDNTLDKGTEEIVNAGVNGVISEAYIIKKLYGKEVEKKFLSKDVYATTNKVVKVGNK